MRDAARAIRSGGSGQVSRALSAGLGLALFVALACAPAGRSQGNFPRPIMSRPDSVPMDPAAADNYDPLMMERMNALNIQRQKAIVSDANKLLKLAKELNEEIAAKNSGTYTNDQLHIIAEIEKLARSVKEKMVDGVEQPSAVGPPPIGYIPH